MFLGTCRGSRSILLNTLRALEAAAQHSDFERAAPCWHCCGRGRGRGAFAALVEFCSDRSEEHTSELQSLMRISYGVFCLQQKTKKHSTLITNIYNTAPTPY